MAQTKAGAAKAMKTIEKRHGKDFHKRIGAIGGSVKGTQGGFATLHYCDIIAGEHTIARCAGIVGGKLGKRPKAKRGQS